MYRRIAIIGLGAAALTLGGCGSREPLEPPPGAAMPVAPLMANRPLTTEELLMPPVQVDPQRVDETMTRSEERADDRFDLPPTR